MFRDPNELSLTRHAPGLLAGWVNGVIAVACLVTFAGVAIGSDLLWKQLPAWVDLGLFRNGLTFFVTFWILASALPPWRMSRWIRVAVLLPVAHILLIGVAWPVWTSIAPYVRDADATTMLATQFPLAPVVGATILGFLVVAIVTAKRRSGEWVHAFTMLALAQLLLLGLWIPIACSAWPGGSADWWSANEPLFVDAAKQIGVTVAPPTLAAIAFTVLALRRPELLRKWRDSLAITLLLVFLVALFSRMSASGRVLLLYSNFLPVLLSAALVAISGLVMLGGVTWWRSWWSERRFLQTERRGATIVDDGDETALGLEITSWLRGPRVVQRSFSVSTTSGSLPVFGAQLVSGVPLATTQLKTGECLTVLRPGDDVQVAGLGAATGDPFRTSAAPVAEHVSIAPASLERGGFSSAALVMWRPCVAYLLIVTAIALPALAALLAT